MRGVQLAVIDLGSNSFRLVVFTATGEEWKRTDEIHEPVRIGEGMSATGELGAEPMERALSAFDVFAHFCQAAGLGAGRIDAVATSAIRDATNSAAFLARARERSGLSVRVLTREQEAHYGYLAAVNSTTLADGCVLDLGGGSMQLVQVSGRLESAAASWRLGAVRTTERFLPGTEPASRKQLDKLRAHVTAKLERAPWLTACGPRLVGLGGTVRNLANAVQRAADGPSIGVQGQCVEAAALDELIERLAELSPRERAKVSGIKPARADLILAGAVVIRTVMEVGGFDALETTEAGLREGVFFAHLFADEGEIVEDVRHSSVARLAAQYPNDAAHTAHVARLALGLFDETAAAGLHDGEPVERELLSAAAALHDIGMSVDYDDHHKHSRYLILSAGLPGFTPTEVALIAQAARYHRKGTPIAGPMDGLLADKGDLARLNRMSVLLRLAEGLERSRDQSVREAHLEVGGKRARLRLVADGDTAVSRWAAGRETELFQRAFGRALEV